MQIRMLTNFYAGIKHGDKDGFVAVPGHGEVVDLPDNIAADLVKSGAACDPAKPYPVLPVNVDLRTRVAGVVPEGTEVIDPEPKRGPGRPPKDADK